MRLNEKSGSFPIESCIRVTKELVLIEEYPVDDSSQWAKQLDWPWKVLL